MKNSSEYKKKETGFEIKTWVIGMVLFFTMFVAFNFADLGNYQWIIILIGLGIIFLYFFIVARRRISLYKKYHAGEIDTTSLNKPLLKGGANFADRRIFFDDNRAYTKYTWFALVLKNIFLTIGCCLLAVTIYKIIFSNNELIFPVAFLATIFILLGSIIKFLNSKQIYFDKVDGIFYLGRRNNKAAKQNANSLQDISEIQIIDKLVKGNKSRGFNCFEVNIVLRDKRRFNVLSHSNYKKLFEDAEKLRLFLNVPISNTNI